MATEHERAHLKVAVRCFTGCAACLGVWLAVGSAVLGFLALAAALGVGVWTSRVGARPAVIVVCLLAAPPGLLGENYGIVGAFALGVLAIALWTAPKERSATFFVVPCLIVGEAGALMIAASAASDSRSRHVFTVVSILYLLAALAARELTKRPALVADALRALAWVVAALCASYALSASAGFAGAHSITLPYRQVTFAPPLTLVNLDVTDYLRMPRFLVMSGEPGLGALFLLVALASALALERGKRRLVLVSSLAVGVVAAQSTGLLFALIAMLCASGFVFVTRRIALIAATVVALGIVPLVAGIATHLIALKRQANPLSIADRGLAGSTATTPISLSATWSHWPLLVVPLVALLVVLAAASARRSVELGLVAGIFVMAWYVQPVQYHPGLWLLVLAVVVARDRAPSPVLRSVVPVTSSRGSQAWRPPGSMRGSCDPGSEAS